ncbi:MAG: thiolase family protein [Deltaproteobacteria bacterium]|nr:thiolase family protein [Deltaproteobacteria bacterium]
MTLTKAHIPYGAYWSTPFCKWQGSLSEQHSVKLAAGVAKAALPARGVEASQLDGLILGMTVPQRDSFYGAPWLAGMVGAPAITGPTVAQACATSARVLAMAAVEVETGQRECVLGLTCDRTSNGPHIYYPKPKAPGGRGDGTDWVWDAFSRDPLAKNAMVETAERVAKAEGFSREEQDEITLLRWSQYEAALADDRAFQRRYMAPVDVPLGRKRVETTEADEGVHPVTADGLAKLRPMVEGGTVTFGSQTHPADGSAGIVVCDEDRATELSRDKAVKVRIVSYGEARVELGMMPKAVVPAAKAALDKANVNIGNVKAVKTHNPFAVNDLYFCRELELAHDRINNFGSPLIYGHPQAPTGSRLVIELIEELVLAGGGYGLFSGCAAGDTAMALVIAVD